MLEPMWSCGYTDAGKVECHEPRQRERGYWVPIPYLSIPDLGTSVDSHFFGRASQQHQGR